MSSNTFRVRNLTSINNENPIKNIKNNLVSNRKKSALKVLTNTVQSTKNSESKGIKVPKILPVQKFETEVKCRSPLPGIIYEQSEEIDHLSCTEKEKDFLPPNMTCNIGMLSNFFNGSNNDENDWFLEDYNNIMFDKIKSTFDNFGNEEPSTKHIFSPLPVMDFPEIILA